MGYYSKDNFEKTIKEITNYYNNRNSSREITIEELIEYLKEKDLVPKKIYLNYIKQKKE